MPRVPTGTVCKSLLQSGYWALEVEDLFSQLDVAAIGDHPISSVLIPAGSSGLPYGPRSVPALLREKDGECQVVRVPTPGSFFTSRIEAVHLNGEPINAMKWKNTRILSALLAPEGQVDRYS